MKIKALILFCTIAVFLTETASFIPAMQQACSIVTAKKATCTKTPEQKACSKKKQSSCSAAKQACTAPKKESFCKKQKNTDEGADDKNCTDNPNCTSCPVCYQFIFQSAFELQAQQFVFKQTYSITNTSYTSVNICDVWKPPNGFM